MQGTRIQGYKTPRLQRYRRTDHRVVQNLRDFRLQDYRPILESRSRADAWVKGKSRSLGATTNYNRRELQAYEASRLQDHRSRFYRGSQGLRSYRLPGYRPPGDARSKVYFWEKDKSRSQGATRGYIKYRFPEYKATRKARLHGYRTRCYQVV